VRSASPQHQKSKTTKWTPRHRAPSKVFRTIKIIGVAGPAVALLGAFLAYQAQSQPSHPVASSTAAYQQQPTQHLGDVVADGAGTAMITQPAKRATSTKPHAAAKPNAAAKPRQASNARAAHHFRSAAKAPAAAVPTPSASPTAKPSRSSSGSGTANLKAAVQKDIASGNYELAIAQYLVENGYSKVAAAGVVGCVDGESGGNPESVGSGGGGLIGWTPISSAAPNPNIITGNPAQDMMTQLADLLYYNSTEIGQSLVNQLNSQSDPVAAADFFSANFEKPAVLYSDVRPSVAQQIFSQL
jgi:hypothetical protein